MEFEWDPKKAERNLRRHGVEFVDAVIVFDDDRAITLVDEHPREERYLTFGMDAQGQILAVSYAGTRERHSDNLRAEGDSAGASSIRG